VSIINCDFVGGSG
jgi:hypothetical protein